MSKAIIVTKFMVDAAGGNLLPSFWLALEGIAQSERITLRDDTINHVIETAKRRHDGATKSAAYYRGQAAAMTDQARRYEEIAATLKPVTKVP